MNIWDILKSIFGTSGTERPSPSDWVEPDAILFEFWNGKLTIDLTRLNVPLSMTPLVYIPPIPDTNSMDGVFDIGNNNILIAGRTPEDHQKLIDYLVAGDIAVYQTTGNPIIHRIIKIGQDGQGKFFRFKGDNNTVADTDKVRESQIQWVSIGVIY